MTEPGPEGSGPPTTGGAEDLPTGAWSRRGVVVGEPPRLPTSLLLDAAELAHSHGSPRLSEAHVLCALLRKSRDLVRLLTSLQVPVTAVEEHLALHLDADVPPDVDVVGRDDGGREIYSYGMVPRIEGRAAVLAAAPAPHPVDAIDVFVSALFDPKSLTTYATAVKAGIDRTRLLADLSGQLGRYGGIAFPPSRVAQLEPPLRVAWASRDEVVQLLSAEVGETAFWSYSKLDDDMLVYAESREILDLLVSRGLGRRVP